MALVCIVDITQLEILYIAAHADLPELYTTNLGCLSSWCTNHMPGNAHKGPHSNQVEAHALLPWVLQAA